MGLRGPSKPIFPYSKPIRPSLSPIEERNEGEVLDVETYIEEEAESPNHDTTSNMRRRFFTRRGHPL